MVSHVIRRLDSDEMVEFNGGRGAFKKMKKSKDEFIESERQKREEKRKEQEEREKREAQRQQERLKYEQNHQSNHDNPFHYTHSGSIWIAFKLDRDECNTEWRYGMYDGFKTITERANFRLKVIRGISKPVWDDISHLGHSIWLSRHNNKSDPHWVQKLDKKNR